MNLIPFPDRVRPNEGRTRLFLTARAELYEQDELGRIWRNDVLVSAQPLKSYGTPRLARPRELIRGEQAAFLFEEDDALGSLHFTGPLRVLWHRPDVGPETDSSWMVVARYDLLIPRPDPA